MALLVNRSVKSPGVLLLSVGGSLDANTFSQLEAEVNDVLNGSVNCLIFDLQQLDFVSSAGIRVLLKAQKELTKRGGEIKAINLQPQIRKVFDYVKVLPDSVMYVSAEEFDADLTEVQDKFRQ